MSDRPLNSPDTKDEKASEAPNPHTFEAIRLESMESLHDFWDDSLSFADNCKTIFCDAIAIPYKDVQLPILLAYACLPSALCTVVPILFLQGQEGSGKSLTSIFYSGVFNQEILSSATTFAAIRNATQSHRWMSPETQEGERNYAVIFDNVNLGTFKNESLYTFFLNGYNRKTDSIQISKGDGSNLVFKVFGPKICSSIHPLYTNPTLSEISRRMLVFKFARLEKIQPEDLGDFDLYERLEIENLDLSLLHQKHYQLWLPENSKNFTDLKRVLTARKKQYKIPKTITSTQWALCPDLIAAGVIGGVWRDPSEAILALEKYWIWNKENVASSVGDTQRAILAYLEENEDRVSKLSEQLGFKMPLTVRCEGLKNYLDNLAKGGALETHPAPHTTTLIMNQLGWRRLIDEDGVWVWVQSD